MLWACEQYCRCLAFVSLTDRLAGRHHVLRDVWRERHWIASIISVMASSGIENLGHAPVQN